MGPGLSGLSCSPAQGEAQRAGPSCVWEGRRAWAPAEEAQLLGGGAQMGVLGQVSPTEDTSTLGNLHRLHSSVLRG